jgi:beta-lactamase class A
MPHAMLPVMLLALGVGTGPDTGGGGSPAAALRPRLQELIADSGVETVAVTYRDLKSGEELLVLPDEIFHAASTMKVPVMMAIVLAAEGAELSLTQPVPVHNTFTSIFDGSAFSVDRERDSDPELHDAVGESRPLDELVERMVVRSSNLATNLVIELVGAPRVEAVLRSIGADDMRVLRGVEDMAAFEAGMNNSATARDLMATLAWIAQRELEGSEAARFMADVLRRQEHRSGIPAGVPTEISVGSKSGWITGIRHDAAIVYPPGEPPYVLVVLTRGFEGSDTAQGLIAAISRTVWQARASRP